MMSEERLNRPLVLLALLFVVGIVLARWLPVSGWAGFWSLMVTLLVAAIAYVWSRRAGSLVLYILFILLGVVAARFAYATVDAPLAKYAGRQVTVTGIVAADPDWRPDRVLYTLDAHGVSVNREQIPTRGRVLVSVDGDGQGIAYGDLVNASGRLVRPQDAGNPGAFDYRAYLERQGIGFQLLTRGDGALTLVGHGYGNGVVSKVLALKARLHGGLGEALSEGQAAVVSGVVFGTRGKIDEGLQQAFTATGVVHILSVSGLHVGFLVGLILFAGAAMRLRPGAVFLLAVIGLGLYTVLVGAKPAVVRAGVMALMLLLANQLGRRHDWPTALAAAALVILLANPLALYDPGFQLSFLATWGILYLGPVIVRGLDTVAKNRGWRWRTTWGWFVAVPLGAQVATLPLVAYYYNLCSPVGLLANLVAVPLVGIIFPLGLLTSIVGAVLPHVAWLTGVATGALVDLFLWMIRLFAAIPGGSFAVPSPHPALIGVWFILCGAAGRPAVLTALCRRMSDGSGDENKAGLRRWVAIAVMAMAGLALYLLPVDRTRPLEIHFIDVGQGDAALVRTPGGEEILIDAGGWPGELAGAPGAGERVMVPYLRRLGVRRLDMFIASHGHEDHIGGIRSVMASIPVKTIVLPPHIEEDELERLAGFAAARGVDVQTAGAGDKTELGKGVKISFLGPDLPLLPGADGDPNNNSLVLRLDYGERSFLFTGDIEQEGQARLIVGGADLRADVLKVPHHGSHGYVPDFFEAVRPEIAVISVGAANRHGLPHPETVARLQALGADLYRTDHDGAVVITTDGHALEVRTGRDNRGADAA